MVDHDDEREGPPACTCGALDRAAKEPPVPIAFDEVTNEFSIVYTDGVVQGTIRIRFCYWCGGAAPRSLRASLFATVPAGEERRLRDLANELWTVEDAVSRLGAPDEDMAEGLVLHEASDDDGTPRKVGYRVIRYKSLSSTAILELTDCGPGRRLRITIQGKYVGPPR